MASSNEELIEMALLRIIELEKKLSGLKALYAERDALIIGLKGLGFTKQEFAGKQFEIKSNFERGNTVFRAVGIQQFSMFISDPSKGEPE